jgi:hypothetical protein
MTKTHSFYIPVMGTGYTIDTPIKVAHLGIDSSISLVDDMLIERLRKKYSQDNNIPFRAIPSNSPDFRAKRITAYLNLMLILATRKIDSIINDNETQGSKINEYFEALPEQSILRKEFQKIKSRFPALEDIKKWLKENLSIGSIDANIMTKVDRENYSKGEKLPREFNDAHAALRGFANSNLHSSIIFSAGINPSLYSYIEEFEDFYPNKEGQIKKKIVLKVSDYKSAMIQGKFLAKKGLWVSEYRIESGLNCGGHAFATNGFLMGPILAEFKNKRQELIQECYDLMTDALKRKNRVSLSRIPDLKITAQGGVGTAEEHEFLIQNYNISAVGWGSPFLLVPDAISIDEDCMLQLQNATEKDLYLSNISPLGVPFNSLKGNSKDIEKLSLIHDGNPGSICPKHYVSNNTEFTKRGICTASRQYQKAKIKELGNQNLSTSKYDDAYERIVEKSCICAGLGTSALKSHNLETSKEGIGSSVCPGPNIAYFSKIMSLKEIIDHIYGRKNAINRNDRPNMFIQELRLYINFLKDKFDEQKLPLSIKQESYFTSFLANLKDGIRYYQELFSNAKESFLEKKSEVLLDLDSCKQSLQLLANYLENLKHNSGLSGEYKR